jgi:hypothetical protein
MISNIECPIFAHDLMNPPSVIRNSDVTLVPLNSKGRINLDKDGVGLQTRYKLKITDPMSLGLLNSEQETRELFITDLVLALNLSLRRTAFSRLEGDLTESRIEFKQADTKVVVERTPEGQHVKVTDVIAFRDSVHITTGITEEIDEENIISNLRRVRKANRHNLSAHSRIQLVSLAKSLSEYESAMSFFDIVMIFKHLFDSLELATNWDGIDRKGCSLDTEAAIITGIEKSEICDWRGFYNRTKHIDRTPRDITEFVQGMEKLPQKLLPLRLASETAIIDRLKKL